MEVGVFDHVERRGAAIGALFADRLRLAEVAERSGFSSYHVAEHHGTPLSMAPSPSVLLAALAERTERIRIGPLCFILPLYDPIRLANEICMLDHLAGGRLELGVGRGVSPIELGFFGVDPAETRAMFEEDLQIILEAFATDELTFHGRYHDYDRVPIELRPAQLPHPPLWYPTSNPDSAAWAGERGFHSVFLGSPAHVAEERRRYAEAVGSSEALAGRKLGVLRYVVVAERDDDAYRIAGPAYETHLRNLHHLVHARRSADPRAVPDTAGARDVNPTDVEDAVRKGWAAVGSPETVAEQVAQMMATTGCNYLLFNPLLADVPLHAASTSVELFGEQVLPSLCARGL